MNKVNPKCSRCHIYFISTIKTSGLPYKSCDKCRQNKKEYDQKNKELIKDNANKNLEKQKDYFQNNNVILFLIKLQQKQIKKCFKNPILDKIEYLGCSIESFIEYFQKKIDYFNDFLATDEIMTFNNIHIDHIKPVSRFNLDDKDEFNNCCHYSNLQPLLAKDNLEKHNKWSEENELYWNVNIKGKDYYKIYL